MSELFESLTGLTLLSPWLLAAALLVPLAVWLRLRSGAPSLVFAPGVLVDPHGRGALPPTWRVRLLPLPRALEVVAILAALVALARPVHRSPLPPVVEGIDILLVLDVSSSMTATDLDPRRSRLEVAKDAAARFVAGRPHDRVGLVAFARYPDVRCPPTLDHKALRQFIAGVTLVASDGPEDATGIGTAVARAAQVLRDSASTSKVVILLTDGEENVATSETPDEIAPLHAGQLCAEFGVRVYAIAAGLGTRDRTGAWADADTRQVRRLAERTGGQLFEARDAGAVTSVYAAIDALEKVEIAEPRYRTEERFVPFLAFAVALFLLARVTETTLLGALP